MPIEQRPESTQRNPKPLTPVLTPWHFRKEGSFWNHCVCHTESFGGMDLGTVSALRRGPGLLRWALHSAPPGARIHSSLRGGLATFWAGCCGTMCPRHSPESHCVKQHDLSLSPGDSIGSGSEIPSSCSLAMSQLFLPSVVFFSFYLWKQVRNSDSQS